MALRDRVRADLLEDAYRTLLAKLDSMGVPQSQYWDWGAFERFVDHVTASISKQDTPQLSGDSTSVKDDMPL